MSKKNFSGFMPMFPGMFPPPVPPMPFMPNFAGWGWSGKNSDSAEKLDDWSANMFAFWDQVIDMQKSSMDGAKNQWEQFFTHMMDMQESFADSLPDEMPSVPGMPASVKNPSPKAFVRNMKQFEEMANDHAMEQADTLNDFIIQGQQQARDIAKEAKDNLQKAASQDNPAAEDKPADGQQQ